MRVVATKMIRNGHKLDIFWGKNKAAELDEALNLEFKRETACQDSKEHNSHLLRSENLPGNSLEVGLGTRLGV